MLVRFGCAAAQKQFSASLCTAIRPAHGSSSPVTHPTVETPAHLRIRGRSGVHFQIRATNMQKGT
jgi:hypothetical protein